MHKRQKKLDYTLRRKEVADKYLKGWTQQDIADKYRVNQATISRDLAAIKDQWIQSAIVDFDSAQARELARIDKLERQYWDAWDRSQEEIKKASQRQKGPKSSPSFTETSQTVEERVGDPRYLSGVQWCIEMRCKLLGLFAPTRTEHRGVIAAAVQFEDLTEDERDRRISTILAEVEAG